MNLFNGLEIFYQYCQKVLKQSFEPDSTLFVWDEAIISEFPFEERKVLVSVMFPSPSGFQHVSISEINAFWGEKSVAEIACASRIARMSNVDREKRRSAFVVVVILHKLGLLQPSNEPTTTAINETALACPIIQMSSRVNLKNKYSASAFVSARVTDASPHRTLDEGAYVDMASDSVHSSPDKNPKYISLSCMKRSRTADNNDDIVDCGSTDFKSKLQQHYQKLHPHSLVSNILKYETLAVGKLFQSTITINDGAKISTFIGDPCVKKKEAEKSAAHKAYQAEAMR